jgi:peptidoglycan/LPS O-acetylase OafA/YrhL
MFGSDVAPACEIGHPAGRSYPVVAGSCVGENGMKETRLNEIDLLRFLAALAVVIFHYAFRGYAADGLSTMPYPALAPAAKYGYLGVDLFFMISGFVILMTAMGGDLRDFAVSRISRLYPAFWTCCTLTFVAVLEMGGRRYSATFSQYIVNMTMLSGFAGIPSLDGAYWSLFVEIRFYILVSIVLLLRRIHQAESFLLAWLIASIALAIWPIGRLRQYLIADYSAYFIAGAFCFLVMSKGLSYRRLSSIIVSWALALKNALGTLPERDNHYATEHSRCVVFSIVTACFVALFLVAIRRTGVLKAQRWAILGALTYPLYLIHQNIGFMIFNAVYPVVNAHVLLWTTLGFVLALAYGVHILVERRLSSFMKLSLRRLLPRTSIAAGNPAQP